MNARPERLRSSCRSPFLRFGLVGGCGLRGRRDDPDDRCITASGVDRYSARAISIFCAVTFTWWGNRNLTFAEHAATGGAAGAGARMVQVRAGERHRRAGELLRPTRFSSASRRRRSNNPLLATAVGVGVGPGLQLHAVEAVRLPAVLTLVDPQSPCVRHLGVDGHRFDDRKDRLARRELRDGRRTRA